MKTRHSPPLFHYDPPLDPFLSVIHQDDEILVLSKPDGLLTVPGKREEHADCLERRAQAEYPGARIVHRLDNATSGVIVMALNRIAHRNLSMQFERRHVQKSYVARVWGHVTDDEGRVDLPLICDWPNRPKQHVDFERGKAAQTDWHVLEREREQAPATTRIQLRPLTGRSHQLRVHMLELGHPILGDRFYASGEALAAAARLQLHSESLTFYHPGDGSRCSFTDPCPF